MKKITATALTAASICTTFAAFAQTPVNNTLWDAHIGTPMMEIKVAELPNDLQCVRRVGNAVRPHNTVTRQFVGMRDGNPALVVMAAKGEESSVLFMDLKPNGMLELAVRKLNIEYRIAASTNTNALIERFPIPRGILPFIQAKDAVEGAGFAIKNCETGGLFPQPLAYSDPAYNAKHTREDLSQRYQAWLKASTALNTLKP